nr:PAS domain S-box protein [Panacagrimonas sp.]
MTAPAPAMVAVLDALPLALAVLDSTGTIVTVNAAWTTASRRNGMGWPHGGMGMNYLDIGRRAAARGDAYADRAVIGLLGVLAGTHSHLAFEYPEDLPGLTRRLLLQGTPCAVGGRRGLVVVHVDVTAHHRSDLELRRRQADARQEDARLQFILDLSVDAICCLDARGQVLSASASSEGLWGHPPHDIIARPWMDLVERIDQPIAAEAWVELQRTGTPLTFKTRCVHRDRRPTFVQWTAQWSGALQIAVAVARNVTDLHVSSTEHQEAIAALRQSEERFRLIARATSDAVWEWDAATGHVWWSQGLGGVFGEVDANWQDGFKAWERRVHPDDLPQVMREFRRVVEGGDHEFSMEYRFRRMDAGWAIVQARGSIVRDDQGVAVRALGGLTDLTELRRAEDDARRAAEVQAFIVSTQQELARPGLGFDDLLQLMCDRAAAMTGASGAVIELCDGPAQTVTRFATAGHQEMLGQAVALSNSFSGEALGRGVALLCRDCSQDPRVDPLLARRAGAVSMIAAPLRRGEDLIGVVKVLSDRRGVFSPANVDHLQSLAETLRIILQRLRSESELARIHRTQRLISLVNLAQARIEEEAGFLGEVCRLAVEEGGYPVACVLYREGTSSPILHSVAHAGAFAQEACRWLVSESEPCREAVLRALRTAQEQPLTITEIEESRCREAGASRGIHGVMVLPLLRERGDAFGVLALFCADEERWSPDELGMLRDLAGGLAFGIRHMQAQRDKRQLEAAVLKVATGVSARTPSEYFEQLCRAVADALEAPAAFVARIVRHSGTPRARTLAGVVDGRLIEPFEYDCVGTPCEQLLQNDEALIPHDLPRLYDMRAMRFDEGQAYAGRSLRDSRGVVVGLLIVLWRAPMRRMDFTRSLLGVFAARAAFELERRQTEIKLREQASLLDQAKDAIVVRDLDGRVRYWNKGAERLYGWSSEEALGQLMADLLDEDVHTASIAIGRVRSEGQWAGQVDYRHRQGRRVPCEAHWTLVVNAEARPQSILTINTDVSARLKVEEQLRQSHRLESVGQLTGGVAHDFNNLLTVILGNAELLTEALAGRPEQRELAEMVRDAAQRGADLTHQLLAFSRRQTLHPQPVDVDRLVAGLMGLLRRTLPETITVEHDAGASWLALIDSAQLESALLNLCLNARDAMPRGGRIRIQARDWTVEPNATTPAAELRPGSYVRVRVIDEGTGISAEDLTRVIEPFFTTKPVGKGTGLGLSMAYGFAKQSQGHLAIESQPERGTTVTLYLPRAPAVVEGATPAPAATPHQGGTESILLVEDDPMVRRFAEGLLSGLGYRVTAAGDGAQALRLLDGDLPVDLLFTDVVMPGGMTGPELVEAGRTRRPGLRALYASGYTENALEDLTSARSARFLQKPYRRAELATAVRRAIAESPDG